MSTKVTFETASFADAIKKAERVAPAKGMAFDKAQGIVIDVMPGESIRVRSTNTEVYYMEWIDSIEVEGESTSWRVPSKLIAGVIGSLSIGSGKTVTLEEKPNKAGSGTLLHLTSGRTKARFNLMEMDYYPEWMAFDPDELVTVSDFGGRLAQVEWAASKGGDVPWCGVHFNGEILVATDRYRCASVPMKIGGLDTSLTIPAGMLSPVLKQKGEMKMGSDQGFILIMPDEHTQIRAITYDVKYPNVAKIMVTDFEERVSFKRSELTEVIKRAMVFAGTDRSPILRVYIGKEEIAVMMADADTGLLGDVVEVPGQASHDRVEILFTPKNLLDALESAPNDDVSLGYELTGIKLIHLDGGSGYNAWVAPRRSGEAT